MSQPIVYASSYNDGDDEERRKKARFQLSVFAVVTEPAYQVTCDLLAQRVTLEIRERSNGESAITDDDVMHLHFGTPATLIAMGNGLIDAARALGAVLAMDATERD